MRAFAALPASSRARLDICAFSDAVQVVAELSAARDVDAVTAIWLDKIAALWLGEDAIAGGQQRWNELTAEILNAVSAKDAVKRFQAAGQAVQAFPLGGHGAPGIPGWIAAALERIPGVPGVGVEIAAAADGDGAAADAVPADQKAAGQIQVGGMPWLVARCPDQLHLVSLPEIKSGIRLERR